MISRTKCASSKRDSVSYLDSWEWQPAHTTEISSFDLKQLRLAFKTETHRLALHRMHAPLKPLSRPECDWIRHSKTFTRWKLSSFSCSCWMTQICLRCGQRIATRICEEEIENSDKMKTLGTESPCLPTQNPKNYSSTDACSTEANGLIGCATRSKTLWIFLTELLYWLHVLVAKIPQIPQIRCGRRIAIRILAMILKIAEGKKGGPERMLCLSLLHVQAVVTSQTIILHLRLWKWSSTPGREPGSEEQQTLHMPCRPLLSSWIWRRSPTAFIEKHTYHH